jgi:hypothetical protein
MYESRGNHWSDNTIISIKIKSLFVYLTDKMFVSNAYL